MSVVTGALVGLVMGVAVVPAPTDLISVVAGPEGYEFASSEGGLTFAEYAELEPDAVAHIDAADGAGTEMSAALDVWTSTEDDILLRQVTRWGDEAAAAAYVAQAAEVAVADGLTSRSAQLGSGIEFVGADANDIVTHLAAWNQGRVAISIELFSLGVDRTDTLHAQAEAFAAELTRATGIEPSADPVATTTEAPPGTPPAATGGGIPISTVLLWLVVIVGGIWLFMKLRKKLRALTPDSGRTGDQHAAPTPKKPDSDEPLDVDDVIERARAESRARREVEEASGPELGEDWKIPDDY